MDIAVELLGRVKQVHHFSKSINTCMKLDAIRREELYLLLPPFELKWKS